MDRYDLVRKEGLSDPERELVGKTIIAAEDNSEGCGESQLDLKFSDGTQATINADGFGMSITHWVPRDQIVQGTKFDFAVLLCRFLGLHAPPRQQLTEEQFGHLNTLAEQKAAHQGQSLEKVLLEMPGNLHHPNWILEMLNA